MQNESWGLDYIGIGEDLINLSPELGTEGCYYFFLNYLFLLPIWLLMKHTSAITKQKKHSFHCSDKRIHVLNVNRNTKPTWLAVCLSLFFFVSSPTRYFSLAFCSLLLFLFVHITFSLVFFLFPRCILYEDDC